MEAVPRNVSDIDRWFKSEAACYILQVTRWRNVAAVMWTVLLTCPFLYSVLAVANISFFHPVNWIIDSLIFVFTPWTWTYAIIVLLMVLLLSRQSGSKLTVVPLVHVCRWDKLTSILQPGCLYTFFTSGLICSVVSWCYTKLVTGSYQNLSIPCAEQSSGLCLNEYHLFVVLHGFYAGLTYRFIATLSGQNYMVFPIIQQAKLFQMRSSILPMIHRSIYVTLNRMRYFYLLYYLLIGSTVKQFLATKVGLIQSKEDVPINSLAGMIDLSLLLHCVLSGSFLHFLLALGTKMHKLYHTEWFQFPIETSVEQYKNLCLHNALGCDKNCLVQYHGYQDLYLLSRHSLYRRSQLFSLTHLGGHPQNWLQVSKHCLQMLHDFSDQLFTFNNKAMTNGTISQSGSEKNTSTVSADLRFRKVAGEKMVITENKPREQSFTKKFVSNLKKYRVIAFFFAEDTEARSRKLFAKAQLYIWAVDALSYLVCASFNEDKFGVVQKSLPQIIESILTLQEQVEKHYRLVPNISKHFDRDNEKYLDVPLRGALKMTLKTAMYRIVSKFGIHIKSVPLSTEHQRSLNHFMEYKE